MGLCLGNNEFSGKHNLGKTRKGDRWLRIILTESALVEVLDTDSALSAQHPLDHATSGPSESDCLGGSFDSCYPSHILSDRKPYSELGAAYLEAREKDHAIRCYVKQLERLRQKVIFEPVA